MTIPPEIIELAIKGGWIFRQGLPFSSYKIYDTGHPYMLGWFEENKWSQEISLEEIICDPLFWQAIGRAKGWEHNMEIHNSHQLFEFLMTSTDPANYWQQILNQ